MQLKKKIVLLSAVLAFFLTTAFGFKETDLGEGEYKRFYANGQLESVEYNVKGKIEGTLVKSFTPEGYLIAESFYKDPLEHIENKFYDCTKEEKLVLRKNFIPLNSLEEYLNFENKAFTGTVKVGEAAQIIDKDGKIIIGCPDSYFENKEFFITEVLNAKKHGYARNYYKNKKIKYEAHYLQGKTYGYKNYNENGILIGDIVFNKPAGSILSPFILAVSKLYNEHGQLIRLNDQINNIIFNYEYYADGKLKKETKIINDAFEDSVEQEIEYTYDADGNVTVEEFVITYDADGNVTVEEFIITYDENKKRLKNKTH